MLDRVKKRGRTHGKKARQSTKPEPGNAPVPTKRGSRSPKPSRPGTVRRNSNTGRAEVALRSYVRDRGNCLLCDERGPTMTTTRLVIAALVTVGLASAPFAAQARKYGHNRH